MKQLLKIILFSVLAAVMVGCATANEQSWRGAMRAKIQRYSYVAKRKLLPYFNRAGVHYPPQALAFLIFKHSARFEVYAKNKGGRWKYIHSFQVLAASGVSGPKLRSGDRQVPEGVYHIIGLNPQSRFDLSMQLNYPSNFDRQMAQRDGRRRLGADIFIHGAKRSIGCVAIGNRAIEQLFPLVYYVGIENVEAIIAPIDFRLYKPTKSRVHPRWLPFLYGTIKRALKPFPLPA